MKQTKQNKNTTQYVLDTTVRKQNTNKTCSFLQTTGGKDEPNIMFMRKSQRTSQHAIQNVKTHNRITQKTKKMSNTNPTKNPAPASYKTPTVLLIFIYI